MKAVIVELRGRRAAALDESGYVSIVANHGYAIGQKITLPHRASGRLVRRTLCAVAAALAVCSGVAAYSVPYTNVSLDGASSLTYSVNIFHRVIGVRATDAASDALVAQVKNNVRGRSVEQAVGLTVHEMQRQSSANTVVVLSVSGGQAAQLARALKTCAQAGSDTVEVQSIAADDTLSTEARQKGVSPGKLYLVRQLHDAIGTSSDFDADAWLGRSVHEITVAERNARRNAKKAAAQHAATAISDTASSGTASADTNSGSAASVPQTAPQRSSAHVSASPHPGDTVKPSEKQPETARTPPKSKTAAARNAPQTTASADLPKTNPPPTDHPSDSSTAAQDTKMQQTDDAASAPLSPLFPRPPTDKQHDRMQPFASAVASSEDCASAAVPPSVENAPAPLPSELSAPSCASHADLLQPAPFPARQTP